MIPISALAVEVFLSPLLGFIRQLASFSWGVSPRFADQKQGTRIRILASCLSSSVIPTPANSIRQLRGNARRPFRLLLLFGLFLHLRIACLRTGVHPHTRRDLLVGRDLPAIGPTVPGESTNITEKMGGVLNELEKAHIFIEQLHGELTEQKNELAQQKKQQQRLEALLTENISE